jgi:hypothetical protein
VRKSRKIMVEKEITTYKCDYCDYSTTNNRGCCGSAPIMACSFCDKDICREHRDFFTEDWSSDYPSGLYACPDCQQKASEAWYWAIENAGRYDDIEKIALERFKEIT